MENNTPPQIVAVPVTTQKVAVTFSHPLSVKLDDKIFLLWQQQILAAVNGHDLGSYIEGDIPDRSSPDYPAWHKQDQLLMSWLLSSMSESVLTRVVGCKRSREVWNQISLNNASLDTILFL